MSAHMGVQAPVPAATRSKPATTPCGRQRRHSTRSASISTRQRRSPAGHARPPAGGAYGSGMALSGSRLTAAAAAPIASQAASPAPCLQRCESGVSTAGLRVVGLGVCAAAAACQFGVAAAAVLKVAQRPERVEAGSADLGAGMTRR